MVYLLKIMFPRRKRWELRRTLNLALIVLTATLLSAGGVALALYWLNQQHM